MDRYTNIIPINPSHIVDSSLTYSFVIRALVAGIFISITCGLLSPLVVLRRMAYSAEGLAHSALGGMAIGMVLLEHGPAPGVWSYLTALIFACSIAWLMARLSRDHLLQSDTAVGVCYTAAFALGILLLSWRKVYTVPLDNFFFGSILAVTPLECHLLEGLAVITLIAILCTWKWLASWTFDEELARAAGIPVRLLHYGFMVSIAATVVLSTRIVGILLITAMLIIPGAVATLRARTMKGIMILSTAVALVSTLTGLAISNYQDVPPGPCIVLIAFLILLMTLLYRKIRHRSEAAKHLAQHSQASRL